MPPAWSIAAGGNLTVTTSGAIDNQRGLLQADDTR